MTSKVNNWNQNMRNDERKEDKPPYSRIFVVCSKSLQEEDLREPFEQFGEVENLYIPRDRNTGESRGVAYIKYSKTSAAAAAIEGLHMKTVKNSSKPIKVLIAGSKNDSHNTDDKKCNRLFIKVHKEVTESEIREHFSEFGHVESVHLQRDKITEACKGLAYVNYSNFLGAAIAYEQCDRKYRPVFATPKDELKRSRNSLEGIGMNYGENSYLGKGSSMSMDLFNQPKEYMQNKDSMISLIKNVPMSYDTVIVTCSPQVPQKHIEQLFNVIPGMLQCHYTEDIYNGFCKAVVTYDCEKGAAFAVERLNNFEFPSGEIVSVKPQDNVLNKAANNLSNLVNSFKNSIDTGNPDLLQLADAIAQASSMIKAATSGRTESKPDTIENYCSVSLPARKPMANSNSRVAQRCFIVCKPSPIPYHALRDAFCRFGDLIDVSIVPSKNYGFVKYATASAAQEAMKILNDAILYGNRLKVVKADEKPSKDDDKMIVDDHSENYSDRDKDVKRIKLNDRNSGVGVQSSP